MSENYRDRTDGVHHRFDSFIKLCAKHKTRNTCRDVENERKYLSEIPLDSVEEILEYHDRYPAGKSIYHEMLLIESDDLEIEHLLKILPERIRKVIILSFIYEKTTGEIAEHLNIHHSTVWKYKSMGISVLREYLTERGNVRQEWERGK